MPKIDSNLQLQAIVVDGSTDKFVRPATNLLSDYDVEFILCDDVYSAVGKLAKNKAENVLIIGRIEQLSRGQGRFFHIACQNGYTCCCLIDDDGFCKCKQILAAMQKGTFVVTETTKLEELIKRLLGGSRTCPSEKRESKEKPTFIKDEFLMTKAELDALLRA